MTTTLEQAGHMLADPAAYTDEPTLHEAMALLRDRSPVHWCTPPRYRPFWAITRHADIRETERNHAVFLNAPRTMLMTATRDRTTVWAQHLLGLHLMVQMDGPHHLAMRKISTDWFRPKVMRRIQQRVEDLAEHHVADLLAIEGNLDFARHRTAGYPLAVLLSLLGLPDTDLPVLQSLTRQLLGTDDAELRRNLGPFAQPAVLFQLFRYFRRVTKARRAHPTDDLASAIANARINDAALSWGDTLSYFAVIATGGQDTTTASIAGGLLALAHNPHQLDLLKLEPELLPHAAQEMIRFTTPLKGFMRTAVRDYDLHGTTIRAGDAVFLSYTSANRDESVFDHPERFDVTRKPNPHLAFGHGVHACFGAALAQLEICAFFAELLPKLDAITITGNPQLIATTFTGGYKHLPLSLTLTTRRSPLTTSNASSTATQGDPTATSKCPRSDQARQCGDSPR